MNFKLLIFLLCLTFYDISGMPLDSANNDIASDSGSSTLHNNYTELDFRVKKIISTLHSALQDAEDIKTSDNRLPNDRLQLKRLARLNDDFRDISPLKPPNNNPGVLTLINTSRPSKIFRRTYIVVQQSTSQSKFFDIPNTYEPEVCSDNPIISSDDDVEDNLEESSAHTSETTDPETFDNTQNNQVQSNQNEMIMRLLQSANKAPIALLQGDSNNPSNYWQSKNSGKSSNPEQLEDIHKILNSSQSEHFINTLLEALLPGESNNIRKSLSPESLDYILQIVVAEILNSGFVASPNSGEQQTLISESSKTGATPLQSLYTNKGLQALPLGFSNNGSENFAPKPFSDERQSHSSEGNEVSIIQQPEVNPDLIQLLLSTNLSYAQNPQFPGSFNNPPNTFSLGYSNYAPNTHPLGYFNHTLHALSNIGPQGYPYNPPFIGPSANMQLYPYDGIHAVPNMNQPGYITNTSSVL